MPLMTSGQLVFLLELVDLRPVERLLVARRVGIARRCGVIALGDVALAAAVVVGVDGEAQRAEAGLDRAVEDRLDPGLVAAHVELEDLQAVRARPCRSLRCRAWTPNSGTSGSRTCRRRRRPRRMAAGSNRSMLPIGASATGIVELAAEERRAGVGAVDVAQNARPERERVEREAIAPHRGLGLGAADQVVPDIAVELGARHGDELVQIVELLADVVDALKRLCGRNVVHCTGHPLICAGARVSSEARMASKAPIRSSIWPVDTRNGDWPSTASAKDSIRTFSESTCS